MSRTYRKTKSGKNRTDKPINNYDYHNCSYCQNLRQDNREKLYSIINEHKMTIMGLKMIFSEDVERYDFIVGYDEFSF